MRSSSSVVLSAFAALALASASVLPAQSPVGTQERQTEQGGGERFVLGPDPVWIVIEQRHQVPIPGSHGALVVHIDDITRGHVRLDVGLAGRPRSAPSVLGGRLVRPGSVLEFDWEGRRYYLGVVRLVNFLIGRDFAEIRISQNKEHVTDRLELPLPRVRIHLTGLRNCFAIAPGLLVGPAPREGGVEELAKHGFETILTLGEHQARSEGAEERGIERILLTRSADESKEDWLARFLQLVTDPARKKKGAIFVCSETAGELTDLAVAAYRLFAQGWSFDHAVCDLLWPDSSSKMLWRDHIDTLRRCDRARMCEAARRADAKAPEGRAQAAPRWPGSLYERTPGFAGAVVSVHPREVAGGESGEFDEFTRKLSAITHELRIERILWCNENGPALRVGQKVPLRPEGEHGSAPALPGTGPLNEKKRYRVVLAKAGSSGRTVAFLAEELD